MAVSDETVYITGSNGAGCETYHTDPDCQCIDGRRWPKEKEHCETVKGLRPCQVCSSDEPPVQRETDFSHQRSLLEAAKDV